jgi:hypothetical protein
MRQTIAALPINLLKPFKALAKLAMPFGCFAIATQFVTLLAAPTAFVRAATCVLHATSFITSFVTLHYTTFVPKQFAARLGTLSHTQS